MAVHFTLENEAVRLFPVNAECIISEDKKTLQLDVDLLLQSELHDAVVLQNQWLYADLPNQLVSLNAEPNPTILLVKDRPAHATLKGELIADTTLPVNKKISCTIAAKDYIYYSAPKKIKTD